MQDSASLSSQLQASSHPGSDALGFGARHAQHELPHEICEIKAATPGPGAYDITATRKGPEHPASNNNGLSASFKPGEVATITLNATGDPGMYNPHQTGDIASNATQNVRESGGKSGFGATTARELRFPANIRGEFADVSPGPAAYKIPSLSHRMYVKSITAFKSIVPQRGKFVLPSAVNPGPGAYDPKDAVSTSHLPGANPDSNIVSKVGRASRYVADSMVSNNGAAGPEVGPGSYEAHILGTIAHDSQQAVAASTEHHQGSSTSSEPRGMQPAPPKHSLPWDIPCPISSCPQPTCFASPLARARLHVQQHGACSPA